MPYAIDIINASLIRLTLEEELDRYDALRLREELEASLEAANVSVATQRQINMVADISCLSRVSAEARHIFASQNKDKRIGRIAVVGFNRAQKVMAHFIMVESKRNNIYFFDTISEAESWLVERA